MGPAVLEVPLPDEFRLFSRGKVRDTFIVPPDMVEGRTDLLLQVTTDRVSALNHKLKPGIPDRGKVLVGLTTHFASEIPTKTHIVMSDFDQFPEPIRQIEALRGRSLIIQRLIVVPMESVIRFRLTGTGWKDYQRTGTILGWPALNGLSEWDEVPESARWTPTAKTANDENFGPKLVALLFHPELAASIREGSIATMEKIAELAQTAGFDLIDGKLEWGLDQNGELRLIDEWGTTDACRWVTQESLASGQPVSYDKDPIRKWLASILGEGRAMIPEIPAELVTEVRNRYLELYRRVTGQEI